MKIVKILAIMISISVAGCTHKEVTDSREPASVNSLITPYEFLALNEILGGDSPLNSYRHKMDVRFYTNSDKEYLSETAKRSLQEAILKSLGGDTPEKGLLKVFASNMKSEIMDNFITTLKVYKIFNTGLQLDLVFAPSANNPGDFAAELSSNQLVRLEDKGRLGKTLDAIESFQVTDEVYNLGSYIPQRGKDFQYVGGVISMYVQILDMSPTLKIPNPFKNGVKGFVRYRRFYKTEKSPENLSCDGFELKAKRAGKGVPLFYTVDLYKNFNISNLIPTEETIEIYPGILAPSNEGRHELMPNSGGNVGPTIKTATYNVTSSNLVHGPVSVDLKKLVYSLKKNRLDKNKSEGVLIDYSPLGEKNDQEQSMALHNAIRTYLKKCETSLERNLRVESLLKGSGL